MSLTVLMECEWVLRGFFKLDAATIAASFRDFLAIESGEPAHAAQADAVRAHQRPEDQPLMTLDKLFVRRAAQAGVRGVAEIGR